MTNYALVTSGNDFFSSQKASYRDMVANLILSSWRHGKYKWYAVLDFPIGIGENFIQMPKEEELLWQSQDKRRYWAKFACVERAMRMGNEDYIIFVDADCEFQGAPAFDKLFDKKAFAFVEGDLVANNVHWSWKPAELMHHMKSAGLKRDNFYNLNGGCFGVRRDGLEEFLGHYRTLVETQKKLNLSIGLSEEPYLAFAIHMMIPDLEPLMAERNLDVFMYAEGYPRPNRYRNWCTKKVTPIPREMKIGIIHYPDRDKTLAENGRTMMHALGKGPS